eukprot:PITA_07160
MAFRFSLTALVFFIICLMFVKIESNEQPHSISLKSACDATLDPKFCVSTMSSLLPGSLQATSADLARTSIRLSVIEAQKAFQIISRLRWGAFKGIQIDALEDCMQLNDITLDHLSKSQTNVAADTLKWRQVVDIQTWLSAALTNQATCVESLQEASGTLQNILSKSVLDVSRVVSNSLALVKNFPVIGKDSNKPSLHSRRLFSNPTSHESHNQVDVDDEFPSWLSASDRRRLLQTSEAADDVVTVAQDGSGNYTTITDALNAAPNNSLDRYVIHITKGVYQEYIEVPKRKINIMLVGDGINATVITGNRSVVDGWTTYRSATVAVVGQGFLARDITFENTAGPEKHQAVALRVASDLSAFYRCSFKGYQDTLYAHSLRQFYRECEIYGTVDFIFGNAAAVFQNCNLLARKPMDNQKNCFTAQGRDDPNQNTGISIQNCTVSAAPDLAPVKSSFQTFLGRPWKNYSRTVYMKSYMDDVVDPAGWLEWSGDFGLTTLYYGEYMNSGPGAGTAERVQWPGYHTMNISDAQNFTVVNFIAGDAWIQAVPFNTGLD